MTSHSGIWAVAAALAFAPAAAASTMPAADFEADARTLGLGVGYGGSVSLDWNVGRGLLAGVSAARLTTPAGNRGDLRVLYRFIDGERKGLSIAGILGLWGDTGFADGPFPFVPPVEGGFALSYPLTAQLTTRLNLIVPLFAPRRPFDAFGGPAAGLEVGYRFHPQVELTLGLNGQGNLVGLRLHL